MARTAIHQATSTPVQTIADSENVRIGPWNCRRSAADGGKRDTQSPIGRSGANQTRICQRDGTQIAGKAVKPVSPQQRERQPKAAD